MQGNAVAFKRRLQRGYLAEMSYRQPVIKYTASICYSVVKKNCLAVELM